MCKRKGCTGETQILKKGQDNWKSLEGGRSMRVDMVIRGGNKKDGGKIQQFLIIILKKDRFKG